MGRRIRELVRVVNKELLRLGIDKGIKQIEDTDTVLIINQEINLKTYSGDSWKLPAFMNALDILIGKHFEVEKGMTIEEVHDKLYDLKYEIAKLSSLIDYSDINLFNNDIFFSTLKYYNEVSTKIKDLTNNPENSWLIEYGNVMENIKQQSKYTLDCINGKIDDDE